MDWGGVDVAFTFCGEVVRGGYPEISEALKYINKGVGAFGGVLLRCRGQECGVIPAGLLGTVQAWTARAGGGAGASDQTMRRQVRAGGSGSQAGEVSRPEAGGVAWTGAALMLLSCSAVKW